MILFDSIPCFMPKDTSIALVIGNGPSVDSLPVELLDQLVTYGCNHIGRKFPEWGRELDNIVITDSNRIKEIGGLYREFRGGLYVGHEQYVDPPVAWIRRHLRRDFVALRQLKKETLNKVSLVDCVRWPQSLYTTVFSKNRFTFDLRRGLNFGYSVVTSAIQLAAMQGAKCILVTGVDTSYKTDKDYFSGMETAINYVNHGFVKNPRVFMEPVLVSLQVHLEALGVGLVDCTPGGKLRFIPKGEFTNEAPWHRVLRPV